jgi:hypothetical protein
MDHKSQDQLLQEMQEARAQIITDALYTHYKNPSQTYTVQGFVVIQATQEIGVLYKANYGAGLTFVRTVSSWLETVDGVPRFTKV